MKKMIAVFLLVAIPSVTFAHDAKLERLKIELKEQLYALLELRIAVAKSQRETLTSTLDAQTQSQTQSPAVAVPSSTSTTQTTVLANTVSIAQPTNSSTFSSSLDAIFSQTPTRSTTSNTTTIPAEVNIFGGTIISAEPAEGVVIVSTNIQATSILARAALTAVKDGEQFFLGTMTSADFTKTFVLPTEVTAPYTLDLRFRGALLDSEIIEASRAE